MCFMSSFFVPLCYQGFSFILSFFSIIVKTFLTISSNEVHCCSDNGEMCLFVLIQNISLRKRVLSGQRFTLFHSSQKQRSGLINGGLRHRTLCGHKNKLGCKSSTAAWYFVNMTTELRNGNGLSVCPLKHCCNKQSEPSPSGGAARRQSCSSRPEKTENSNFCLYTTLFHTQ